MPLPMCVNIAHQRDASLWILHQASSGSVRPSGRSLRPLHPRSMFPSYQRLWPAGDAAMSASRTDAR
ncbi:hypothetical protein C2E23DRAFT_821769 [Lenzites betulinus]|nr:hypothetical protein C2E23DRAFT_821769 [Lenzites betulinus]